LNIHTTPSPADPAEADEFYKAFGIMMIARGRLEIRARPAPSDGALGLPGSFRIPSAPLRRLD
jgi:hypothetical protein